MNNGIAWDDGTSGAGNWDRIRHSERRFIRGTDFIETDGRVEANLFFYSFSVLAGVDRIQTRRSRNYHPHFSVFISSEKRKENL